MPRFILIILLTVIVWIGGVKPLIGEFWYSHHLKTGKVLSLFRAIDMDKNNSQYLMTAAQVALKAGKYDMANDYIDKVITSHNGDLVLWAVYYLKAIAESHVKNSVQAYLYLQKSLEYYPKFKPALDAMEQIHGKKN